MDLVQALIILGAAAGLTFLIASRHGVWSVPTFVAGMFFVGFPVRLLFAISSSKYRAFGLPVEQRELVNVAWVGLAGLIAFSCGLLLDRTKRPAAAQAPPIQRADERRVSTRCALILLCLALGALALQMGALAWLFGGFERAVVAFSQRTITNARAVGFLGTLLTEAWQIPVSLSLGAFFYAVRGGSRWPAPLALVLIVMTLPWYSTVNGRAAVVVVLWALAMLSTRILGLRVGVVTMVGMAASTALATVIGHAVRLSTQVNLPVGIAIRQAWSQALMIVSDALPMLDAFYVAREFERLAGQNFSAVVLAPFVVLVPRDFWPDKPVYLPQMIATEVFHAPISGLPAGLLGEGYIALGAAGVLLFPLLVGLAAGRLDRVLDTWKHGYLLKCWFVFQISEVALTTVRVGFQGALIGMQLALLFLPVLLALQWLISRQVPPSRAGSPWRAAPVRRGP